MKRMYFSPSVVSAFNRAATCSSALRVGVSPFFGATSPLYLAAMAIWLLSAGATGFSTGHIASPISPVKAAKPKRT